MTIRDTDWFVLTFCAEGVIEMSADAELPLYVAEIGPQDCSLVDFVQHVIVGPCQVASLTITGEPFTTVWFWTGATEWGPPDSSTPYEFDYILWLSGLAPGTVATEARTWGEVKGLFD